MPQIAPHAFPLQSHWTWHADLVNPELVFTIIWGRQQCHRSANQFSIHVIAVLDPYLIWFIVNWIGTAHARMDTPSQTFLTLINFVAEDFFFNINDILLKIKQRVLQSVQLRSDAPLLQQTTLKICRLCRQHGTSHFKQPHVIYDLFHLTMSLRSSRKKWLPHRVCPPQTTGAQDTNIIGGSPRLSLAFNVLGNWKRNAAQHIDL